MSTPDRRAMLERGHPEISIRGQCRLLGIARSGVYRPAAANDDADLALMRRIDVLFMAWPFLGSRRMTAMLRAEGQRVNRKRVQRLMRLMGIAALGPKPKTTKPAPGHKIFPYLLRDLGMTIDRPNQVWAADITYIPIGRGYLYLVAIIPGSSPGTWASRAVLAWRLSNTMDVAFGERRHPDLHGRPRPLDGQRLHRTAVAVAEVRGRLSEGLRRRPRGAHRYYLVDRLLQWPTSSSSAGRPNPDGGVARGHHQHRGRQRRGHGPPARWPGVGRRCRVAHMPTATTATNA